jgi:hypothetical protein
MKQIRNATYKSRRQFLRQLAIFGGAGGIGTLAARAVAATETEAAADAGVQTQTPSKRGYHETDHIRSYYAKADF